MVGEDKSGSRFIVDLGDVKLPPLVEKQVEAKIQAVVLGALAESNINGQGAAQDRIFRYIWDKFPGQTLGLWPKYPNNPPDIFGHGGSGPLVIQDHTIIMKAIMEHPLQVIRYLPNRYKSKTGGRPSGGEVLQAALRVDQIDDYTKGRIRAVLELLPEIEARQASLPESLKQAVDDLRQQLANKSVAEKRSLLRDSGLRRRYRDDGLADGMEFAAQLLEDGRDSIYSPDHGFYKMLQGTRGSSAARAGVVGDIADADGIGGAAGAVVGSFFAVVGAGLGAVVGGAGASSGAAASELLDWLYEDD